jgi:hypothetical protein
MRSVLKLWGENAMANSTVNREPIPDALFRQAAHDGVTAAKDLRKGNPERNEIAPAARILRSGTKPEVR